MNKKITIVATLFFLFGWSNPVDAQPLNGDFSSGGQHWEWFRADTPFYTALTCQNGLSGVNWVWNNHVIFWDGSREYVASGHDGNSFTGGQRLTCGAIRQNVQIPPASRLRFDYWLGKIESDISRQLRPVTLRADIIQGQNSSTVHTVTGQSERPICESFSTCPSWKSATADVSEFWGQNVTLQFFSQSSYARTGGVLNTLTDTSSPAHIDNILFEPIPPNTFASPTAGIWYNPGRDGHGIDLTRSSTGQYMVVWYTYLPSGAPIWYMSDVKSLNQGTWNGTLSKMTRDPDSGSMNSQSVGTAKITMLSNSELIYEWNLNSQSGSPSSGAERMTHLFGGGSYTGLWYEPADSGWGISLSAEGSGQSTTSVSTAYFYTDSGQPIWAQGVASGSLDNGVTFDMSTYVGTGLCPGCAGQTTSTTGYSAGTLNMRQLGSFPQGYSNIQTAGGVTWIRGSANNLITYGRLTFP